MSTFYQPHSEKSDIITVRMYIPQTNET